MPIWLINSLILAGYTLFLAILIPRLMSIFRKIAKKTKNRLDDVLIESIASPLIFIFIGIGIKVFTDVTTLPEKVNKYTSLLGIILIVISIILFFDRIFVNWIRVFSKRINFVKTSGHILKVIFRISLFAIAILIILDSLGISITPIIASLGVASLAVALALQDTLGNFFSGIQILADRPIKVGDYIRLESGEQGFVEKIGWRTTSIRLIQNNITILPNSKLANSQITNYSLPEPQLSVLIQVGVSYDSDLEKVEKVTIEVGKKVLKDITGGIGEFDPLIRYHTFGDFSINFTVILRVSEYVNKYLVTHEFIKRLHKRYQKEGIEIPFPIMTVKF